MAITRLHCVPVAMFQLLSNLWKNLNFNCHFLGRNIAHKAANVIELHTHEPQETKWMEPCMKNDGFNLSDESLFTQN